MLGTFDDIPGGGVCVGSPRSCYLDPIEAEGGDTLNGQGDPNTVNSVALYCIDATNSSAINSSAGRPGPGRRRLKGTIATNGFTSLP